MQNKPNLRKGQMNITSDLTTHYEQITMNYFDKNKPNSKPNKPNFKTSQIPFLAKNKGELYIFFSFASYKKSKFQQIFYRLRFPLGRLRVVFFLLDLLVFVGLAFTNGSAGVRLSCLAEILTETTRTFIRLPS